MFEVLEGGLIEGGIFKNPRSRIQKMLETLKKSLGKRVLTLKQALLR